MKFYQLVGRGFMMVYPDSTHKVVSNIIFRSPQEAEQYIPKFKKLVTTPINNESVDHFNPDGFHVTVSPLEVFEPEKYPNEIFEEWHLDHPERQEDEIYVGSVSHQKNAKNLGPWKCVRWGSPRGGMYPMFVKKCEIINSNKGLRFLREKH